MKKLSELSKKELFLYNLKKRSLYYLGYIFIYLIPIILIMGNLKTIQAQKQALNTTWVIVGIIYLVFFAKFIKSKILALKPCIFKSFMVGLLSLLPVIIITTLIQLVQDLIKDTPHLDIAQWLWYIVTSCLIGLFMQLLDSIVNQKYLTELEIIDLARQQIAIDKKKTELTNP